MRKESTIVLLLVLGLPFGVWSYNILQGHLNALIFIVCLGTSLMLPSIWLKIIGVQAALWLAVGYLWSWVSDSVASEAFEGGCIMLLLGMLIVLFAYYSKPKKETWLNVICISAILQSVIGIIQFAGLDPVSWFVSLFREVITTHGMSVGTLGNQNFLAAYLAISMPLFFRKGWGYFIPLLVVCLVFCKTTTAATAAIIASVFFVWPFITRNMKYLVVVISVSAILLYGFWYHSVLHSIGGIARIEIWSDAIAKITSHWSALILGVGPGISWAANNELHNEYIGLLFNYGIIGLVAALAYIYHVFTSNNRMLKASATALFIDMIGNHPLHTVVTATLAAILIGLIEREMKWRLI